jgi:hypothetical protein
MANHYRFDLNIAKYLRDYIPNKNVLIIYRLMNTLFHSKTVIIPRDRYRPESRYRSRDDNSPEKCMH